MNLIFLALILIAYVSCVFQQLNYDISSEQLSPMHSLTESMFGAANDAVTLSIGLIGLMTFFLGLMKVAEQTGLLRFLAKCLHPILSRLFPDVPADHPAMGAMVMNICANLLGLGNAATPFGIKAMHSLNTLNQSPGVATNAMVLFLAINTSSVTLIPTKVIALRHAAGSVDPSCIISTTLFATLFSTLVAILAAKSFEKFFKNAHQTIPSKTVAQATPWYSWLFIVMALLTLPITLIYGKSFSAWIIPSLTVFILSLGYFQKIPIYETFTDGAKEGFEIAVKIIPYLVAILVAIAMIKSCGALDFITQILSRFTAPLGLPADALPMALMRPLSGGGSLGVLSSIIGDPNIGPDSYTGVLVSTIMGSTETTFYIIAVYYGAIQIKRMRHTLIVALLADLAGVIGAVIAVQYWFGH